MGKIAGTATVAAAAAVPTVGGPPRRYLNSSKAS